MRLTGPHGVDPITIQMSPDQEHPPTGIRRRECESGTHDTSAEGHGRVHGASLPARGADPTTANLADAEHVTLLWNRLASAVDGVEQSFSYLAGVRLQDLYADLERLETVGDSGNATGRMKERERLLALFNDYASAEQKAAALEQRIVGACRLLEKISPEDAVDRLREVEQLLSPQSLPGTPPG